MRWGQTLSNNHEKLVYSLQDISDSWRLQVDLKSFPLRMERKGPLQPPPRQGGNGFSLESKEKGYFWTTTQSTQ